MDKLQELMECLSATNYHTNYVIAKSSDTCIMCGRPAAHFRDASTRLEYNISALCEHCQDACFIGKKKRLQTV